MRAEPPIRERGAALLTVLMLVAVIAVMAGAGLERLRLSTRLAANAARTEQARAWAIAAETLMTTRIGNLLAMAGNRVTLLGGWSGRPYALPLPGGGTAVGRVTDGGNCFNLNGLVVRLGPGVYASNALAREQFARLMRLVGIPGQVAEQVAAGTSDWIDTDNEQQAGGAEDGRYTGQQQPYRTGGTLMADPSELRAVIGVTPRVYEQLRPWVCTLPVAQPAPMNVNTLEAEQAPLLAMLANDTLSVEAARQLLLRRPAAGWSGTDQLWAGTPPPSGAAAGQLATTSKWFDLTIDVTMPGTQLQEHALIDATRLPVRLVARQWGEDL